MFFVLRVFHLPPEEHTPERFTHEQRKRGNKSHEKHKISCGVGRYYAVPGPKQANIHSLPGFSLVCGRLLGYAQTWPSSQCAV
jgi:hypothetical protein